MSTPPPVQLSKTPSQKPPGNTETPSSSQQGFDSAGDSYSTSPYGATPQVENVYNPQTEGTVVFVQGNGYYPHVSQATGGCCLCPSFYAAIMGNFWGFYLIGYWINIYIDHTEIGLQSDFLGWTVFLKVLSGMLHIAFNCTLMAGVSKRSRVLCSVWLGGMAPFILSTGMDIMVFNLPDGYVIPSVFMGFLTIVFISVVLGFMHAINPVGGQRQGQRMVAGGFVPQHTQ